MDVVAIHLHSTMYLLKQVWTIIVYISVMNLHSTMYLLKQGTTNIEDSHLEIYIPLCIY